MYCGKHALWFFFIIIALIILYLLFTDQYTPVLQSIPVSITSLFSSNINASLTSRHSTRSKKLWTIDFNSSQPLFQPRIHPYHPYLPIHIYTQNVTSLGNISKVILLGNGFFEDTSWGLAGTGISSSQQMTQLSCPFLAHYCSITNDQNLFSEADAVVYHMRDKINLKQAKRNRQPEQRFVFAVWESPAHTPDFKSYNGFFNWTMTYRFTSDIVSSYYSGDPYIHTSSDYYHLMIRENATKNLNLQFRTIDHRPSDAILAEKKLGTVAALISNHGGASGRLVFIRHLKRYVDVKVYGRQGEACPKNVGCLEFIAKNYYFFLGFENSLCRDYTTEKFFAALQHPIVPVVLGLSNYSHFIPSSGFIDTNDFANVSTLGRLLIETRKNKEKYLSYFAWKKDFVWGRKTFFTPFCDLCLRLHLDPKPSVIDDINTWWHQGTCQKRRQFKPYSMY